jgi:hypothetical protein
MYQLLSNDLKTMEKQHQDVDVVWFLLNLKPEYETVRLQISVVRNFPVFLSFFLEFSTLSFLIVVLNSALSVMGISHFYCLLLRFW